MYQKIITTNIFKTLSQISLSKYNKYIGRHVYGRFCSDYIKAKLYWYDHRIHIYVHLHTVNDIHTQ